MRKIINKIGKVLKPMIPNLPTDNLYKFGFVSFIFLLCLLIYVRYNENITLIRGQNSFDLEYYDISVKKNQYQKESDANGVEKKKLNDQINYINNKKQIINKKVEDFNKKSLSFTIAYIALSILSIIMLLMWYFKLQKFQDIIIKNQALNDTKMQ